MCCAGDEVQDEGSGECSDISVYGTTSSSTVPLERDVHAIGDSERKEKQMRVLHEAMKLVVRPMQKCKLKGFLVRTPEVVEWNASGH